MQQFPFSIPLSLYIPHNIHIYIFFAVFHFFLAAGFASPKPLKLETVSSKPLKLETVSPKPLTLNLQALSREEGNILSLNKPLQKGQATVSSASIGFSGISAARAAKSAYNGEGESEIEG